MALAILTTVLVTAFNLANQSMREGMQAREHSQAAFLAQQQAELLRLYRDELIATTSSDTPVITNNNFPCTTSCHMVPSSGSSPATSVAVPVPSALATAPFNGVEYNLSIQGAADVDQEIGSYKVTVTWTSAVSNEANKSTVDVLLVDKRNIKPMDCSTICS